MPKIDLSAIARLAFDDLKEAWTHVGGRPEDGALDLPLTEEELALLKRAVSANLTSNRTAAIQFLELRLHAIQGVIDSAENWGRKELALEAHLRVSKLLGAQGAEKEETEQCLEVT